MMNTEQVDVAIIGAGAAGLAAASVTAQAGFKTLVVDRENFTGGVLRQCIHNGFGLEYFKQELTGPEFADMIAEQASSAGARFALENTVMKIERLQDGRFRLTLLSSVSGVQIVESRSVLLAMGCRERNRGNLAIPGTRCAGIFTAGTAQRLMNREGLLPGKSAVIVGSGDIGLIMARRLRWSGVEVKGVIEIMPHPSGLTRNVAQCLEDFGIPLWLQHSVVNICGKERVEGVDVAPLVNGEPDMARCFHIACDTLLFSVGLVPETELATDLGAELNPATGGAIVDANYETTIPGMFSAGNVLHVHDLVDFVAAEAERAAKCMICYLQGQTEHGDVMNVSVNSNLKYVVPSRCFCGRTAHFAFRPLVVADKAILLASVDGRQVLDKKLLFVRPAQMIDISLDASVLNGKTLVFDLQKSE